MSAPTAATVAPSAPRAGTRSPAGPVLVFSRFPPKPDGHGGCHRSHQLWRECVEVLGEDRITLIPYTKRSRAAWTRWHRWWTQSVQLRRNPLSVLGTTAVAWDMARAVTFSEPLRQYETHLRERETPALCIVEDAVWFSGIILANQRRGIPTWTCPQNLESLDFEGPLDVTRRARTLSRLGDLAGELTMLKACQARFAISRVEAGFLSGVGLDTEFYPYRPVGEVREFFTRIRAARQRGSVQPGLVVLIGSATHVPAREGMEWFLGQARAQGLPAGVRIEIAGVQTDKLPGLAGFGDRVVARGWVEPAALEALLSRAQAALIPQFSGFGALTRLSELPMAGIPVLASAHAVHSVDAPGDVVGLPRRWERWAAALQAAVARDPVGPPLPDHAGPSALQRALAADFGAGVPQHGGRDLARGEGGPR